MKLLASPLRSVRSAVLLSALLAAVFSANSLRNDFAYDDNHIITENTAIQSLETLPDALVSPYWPGRFGRELGLWRPTTTLLLGLEWAVAGPDPLLYHLVNVVAHIVTTGLVVLVLAELMTLSAAFVGGLVFAVHPVHVEAVANVIGIAEILPALLFLLACLVHLRGTERTSWPRALVMGALYATAFGAKESAVTLPGVIFLLDAARQRLAPVDLPAYVRDRWKVYLVLVAVASAMLIARLQVLGSIANPFGPLGADLLAEVPRIWTLGEVWSNYVRLMVLPLDLSADYSPGVIPISLGWHAANLVGVFLALATLGGAWAAWRRPAMEKGKDTARVAGFGVVWFLITISPLANVFFISGVLLAERTLYLPSVGFAAALGWLVVRLARERRTLAVVTLTALLTFMGWRTWTRNPTWRDNFTVFGTLIADYPHSGRSQWVLGDLFFQQGRPHQGLVSYRAAINILGPHYQLITEISKKLIDAGYYEAAEHLLLFTWRDSPGFALAPGLLAVVYSQRGMPEETEIYCRIALAIDGDDAVREHLLAWALAEQGRWEEAATARQAAIALGEGEHWEQWVSLAHYRAQAGDTVAARTALDSARVRAGTKRALQEVDSLAGTLRAGTFAPPDTVSPGSPTGP
ncbi:MAG TPA: tetratricopeptide repeat protein [Longimicrobiales bacterium]|nr:tetratricopeptide repeat protein [Longimicrobiales bacterium]